MKALLLKIFIFVSFFNVLYSCDDQSESIENNTAYENSLTAWNDLKEVNGSSYTYEVITKSVFDFGSTTQITVIDNIVVSRNYEAYNLFDENNMPLQWDNRIITNSYSENSTNLNINNEGASALTIDELYNLCLKDYLTVNPKRNTIYFNVDTIGVLENCGFTPNGCQDDCYTGVTLSNFEWINKTCDIINPTKNLDWLKEKISELEQTHLFKSEKIYILQATYNNTTVFLEGNCCAVCNTVVPIYNCEGESIGTLGQHDFNSNTITNSHIIWISQNTVCFK